MKLPIGLLIVSLALPAMAEEKLAPALTAFPRETSGRFLLGGGLMHNEKLGFTVLSGYEFRNGWHVLAGPTFTPHEDIHGFATLPGVRPIPYNVQAPKPLGWQALAIYAFPK